MMGAHSIRQLWSSSLQILKLAGPLTVSTLSMVLLGFVELLIAGKISTEAVGISGYSVAIISLFAFPASGFVLGIDYLVSRARQAGHYDLATQSLFQGAWLSLALTGAIAGILLPISFHPGWIGLEGAFGHDCGTYLKILFLGIFPVLINFACRQYLNAFGRASVCTRVTVAVNALNAALAYSLTLGKWGAPRLGIFGCAWADVTSQYLLVAGNLAVIAWGNRGIRSSGTRVSVLPKPDELRELLRLGRHPALKLAMDTGIIVACTAMAARLSAADLATHQVLRNYVLLAGMPAIGVATAAAVTVGDARSRSEFMLAIHRGWSGWTLGILLTLAMSAGIAGFPRALEAVLAMSGVNASISPSLLSVAAVFVLAYGVQAIGSATLRGAGEARTSVRYSVIGQWAIGLPVSYVLCFHAGMGVHGIWIGMCVGMALVGGAIVSRWRHYASTMKQAGFEVVIHRPRKAKLAA